MGGKATCGCNLKGRPGTNCFGVLRLRYRGEKPLAGFATLANATNFAGSVLTVPPMRAPFAFSVALRTSLWFVPMVVVLGSIGVAHALVEAGARIPALSQNGLPALFAFGAEGSRSMLSGIATSMMTVAGVAFSVTIVTLSLASSQYSPRVLRQFMRDRANQWVLGVFVGIFAFCLTVLPRIRGAEEHHFVPALAVAAAVVYALIGVGCLIFFIHHIATAIQVSYIVADIAAETRKSAEDVFSDELDGSEPADPDYDDAGAWEVVNSPASGYIQLVKEDSLLDLAERFDVVMRMERGVGEFILKGMPMVSVQGANRHNATLAADVSDVFTINRARTIEQDVMHGVRQIVDVALRALSPSLNDPTTAILCVDYLTTIVCLLATRSMGRRRCSVNGRLRLVASAPTFEELVAASFGQIRANAGTQAVVFQAIIRAMEALSTVTNDPGRRQVLAAEAAATRDALRNSSRAPEVGGVCERADRVVAKLQQRHDAKGAREGVE